MKKFLLAIATAIAATFGMSAQSADITIGYGGYTQMDATNCHDGWHHVNNAWGAVTAGVNFHVLRNFALGPSYLLVVHNQGRARPFVDCLPRGDAQRTLQLLA